MHTYIYADVSKLENKPNGLGGNLGCENVKDDKNSTPEVNETMPSSGKIVTQNLKMFTLQELRAATKNFRPDTMLGEGGFGRVFKGWIDDKTYVPSKVGVGMAVAVKKSNPDSLQGLQEWQVSSLNSA